MKKDDNKHQKNIKVVFSENEQSLRTKKAEADSYLLLLLVGSSQNNLFKLCSWVMKQSLLFISFILTDPLVSQNDLSFFFCLFVCFCFFANRELEGFFYSFNNFLIVLVFFVHRNKVFFLTVIFFCNSKNMLIYFINHTTQDLSRSLYNPSKLF